MVDRFADFARSLLRTPRKLLMGGFTFYVFHNVSVNREDAIWDRIGVAARSRGTDLVARSGQTYMGLTGGGKKKKSVAGAQQASTAAAATTAPVDDKATSGPKGRRKKRGPRVEASTHVDLNRHVTTINTRQRTAGRRRLHRAAETNPAHRRPRLAVQRGLVAHGALAVPRLTHAFVTLRGRT